MDPSRGVQPICAVWFHGPPIRDGSKICNGSTQGCTVLVRHIRYVTRIYAHWKRVVVISVAGHLPIVQPHQPGHDPAGALLCDTVDLMFLDGGASIFGSLVLFTNRRFATLHPESRAGLDSDNSILVLDHDGFPTRSIQTHSVLLYQ